MERRHSGTRTAAGTPSYRLRRSLSQTLYFTTLDVVTLLRQRMDEVVRDYDDSDPDGVRRVGEPIDGTAFFPGGHGVWRGLEPHGPMPEHFPDVRVMFVGHNFDSVLGYQRSCRRGIEVIRGVTWRRLLEYVHHAGLQPEQCFYTNALMGLQPTRSVGPLKTTELFRDQCRSFLREQIDVVKPAVIAALGNVAAGELANVRTSVPVLTLMHPRASIRRMDLAQCEGERLRQSLLANASRTKPS